MTTTPNACAGCGEPYTPPTSDPTYRWCRSCHRDGVPLREVHAAAITAAEARDLSASIEHMGGNIHALIVSPYVNWGEQPEGDFLPFVCVTCSVYSEAAGAWVVEADLPEADDPDGYGAMAYLSAEQWNGGEPVSEAACLTPEALAAWADLALQPYVVRVDGVDRHEVIAAHALDELDNAVRKYPDSAVHLARR